MTSPGAGDGPGWLTPEWFGEVRSLAAELPPAPGVDARIQGEVVGGPDGAVAWCSRIEGGRVVDAGPGRIEDPDVTLTLSFEDARSISRAELDPSVAFMQGRLKVAGSPGVVLALLALAAAPERRAFRARVAERTRS